MSSYAFHPDAFADLDEIWEYIAQDNVVPRSRFGCLAVFHGRRNPRLLAAVLRDRE